MNSKSIVGLSLEEKRTLLAKMLKKKVVRLRRFALSYAQERLWFIDRLQPGSAAYNVPGVMRLGGVLGVEALERAINEIMRRHEVLRTTFEISGGGPVQVIHEPMWKPLAVVDLGEIMSKKREGEARRLIVEESGRAFDLKQGPVVRTTLVRLRAEEHVILYTLHHIASDGWSVGVLNREIGQLYEAFCAGKASPLEDLPIQYADFAVWQRGWLKGEVLAGQLGYWKGQLEGLNPLQLPTDHPRPVMQTFGGALQGIRINPEVVEALKELSQREGVTLYMTILAGLQVLLSRYSGQEDVAIGSVIANRNRKEIENLIGFFVNTLVMRTDLTGDPTVRELLGRVKEVTLGAYGHQDLPFEKLVEELQPERDLSRNPLVQVVLELLNAPDEGVEMKGMALQPMGGTGITTRFDLEVHFREQRQGLTGWVVFNPDLFEGLTIERMVGHLERVLDGMARSPGKTLSELELLSEVERQLILGWNNFGETYGWGKCVHELFEEQVRRRPGAVAVVFNGEQLSYGQLNERANRLGHYLCGLGVGPEVKVGLCVERSLEMVIGVLGIVKAGGAYVPMDPAYPQERLVYMAEDARVKVVLTVEKLRLERGGYRVPVVSLDREWEKSVLARMENVGRSSDPEQLLYEIYTSGSSGKPKGVQVSHYNLARLFKSTEKSFGFGVGDVWTMFHSYAFDFSVWEMWGALVYGGRLVVVPYEVSRSPEAFYELLIKEKVTVLNQTPSAFGQLQQVEEREKVRRLGLRVVIFGGEAMSMRSLGLWFERHGEERPRLVNMYGITETTVHVTYRGLKSGDVTGGSVIGRALGDLQVYILDGQKQLAPVGVSGEIYVGGAGLARGYEGRAELTAERFVPDHVSGKAGGRLYRSGDLGRYLGNGDMEYLGRIDQQVKIRGYRIELGEIETALLGHPRVKESVVLVREQKASNKRLVGYVVGRGSKENDGGEEEQVSEWQRVFDEHLYEKGEEAVDPTFNIVGWESSYDGEPIPAEEMREWLEDTLERLRARKPQRVLEIGCGTGMVLFGLARECKEYWGTDFSQSGLEYIERQLGRVGIEAGRVKLLRREANDFGGMEGEKFSAVVLNSVVQYFPDIEYLVKVLEGAVGAVEEGGFIFLGDVRSLPLGELFAATVQLSKAGEAVSVKQLRQRAEQQWLREKELLIDPMFFYALKQRLGRIGKVEVVPKRGKGSNELMKFRYQVILHLGEEHGTAPAGGWLDWEQQNLTLEAIGQELRKRESLGIRNVANARLSQELKTVRLLREAEPESTVAELKRKISGEQDEGEDPGVWEELGKEMGYEVELSWRRHDEEGRYDVLFWKGERRRFEPESGAIKDWREYANDPLYGKLARRLVPELKSYMEKKVPKYMVPAAIVVLKKMPLTANGKVDRKALPEPEVERMLEEDYMAPRNEVEKNLAEIWTEVLGIGQAGIHDDFFELGGHSLLATQVVSRVREVFELELPLRHVFETPTIAALGGVIAWALKERAIGNLEGSTQEEGVI